MRELFFDNLPLGEKKQQVEDYFNCLEKAIDTKDPDEFRREEFPPDDPATCGDRVYKYHSAAHFKQHASQQQVQQLEYGSGMGNSQESQAKLSSTENPAAENGHLACIQEHPTGHGAGGESDGRSTNPCPDIQGQLDA